MADMRNYRQMVLSLIYTFPNSHTSKNIDNFGMYVSCKVWCWSAHTAWTRAEYTFSFDILRGHQIRVVLPKGIEHGIIYPR